MPANLTPQYQRLEEQYRRAHTAQERADLLEEILATIPKHKGTEKLQADLKTKLKETKAEPEVAPYPFTTREPMPGMMA